MYFNGLDVNMGNLFRLSDAKTRSISAENKNGGKGMPGEWLKRRKCSEPRARTGVEGVSVCQYKSRGTIHCSRHKGPGRNTAYLDDSDRKLEVFYTLHILGRSGVSVG